MGRLSTMLMKKRRKMSAEEFVTDKSRQWGMQRGSHQSPSVAEKGREIRAGLAPMPCRKPMHPRVMRFFTP